ncbi:MAG: NAD kinase [Prevotella sp.]|jgi:NAD+ kinase|nr:NAD kinase [Prevotella sp.]
MKIGIFGNSRQQKEPVQKIIKILSESKVETYVQKRFFERLNTLGVSCKPEGLIDEDDNFAIDMALSIGGDGTFLQTASLIGKNDIPILGINTGRLGFLSDVSSDDVETALPYVLSGKYRIEERTQLTLTTESKAFQGYNYALNEVAVLKQDSSSMITIHAQVNGEYLTSYQADGLIVATPTGSTAYSLSVGGPVLSPDSTNFLLSAIAPHSLTTRPLVIKDDSIIALDVESRNGHFLVSLDGRSEALNTGTRLEIKKGHFPLRVVKRVGHTFYETLREKLLWGADPRIK